MASLDLINYVRDSLASGTSAESIKNDLAGAGWSQTDIADAFRSAGASPVASAPLLVNTSPLAITNANVRFDDSTESKKPIIKIIIIALVSLLALGALAYGAFWFYNNKMPRGASLTADQALVKSLENLKNAKAWSISGELALSDIKLSEKLDLKKINPHLGKLSPDAKLSFVFKEAFDNGQNTAVPLINSSAKLEIQNIFGYSDWYGFDFTSNGKRVFVKLDGQGFGEFKDYFIDVMDGHWFEVNMKGVIEALKLKPEDVESYKLSQDEQNQLIESAKTNKIFNVENLPDETVKDQNSYHYKLTVNKEGLKQVAIKYFEIISEKAKNMEEDKRLVMLAELRDDLIDELFGGHASHSEWGEESDQTELKVAIGKAIDDFKAWPQMEYWVDKAHYNPLQFTLYNNLETSSKSFSAQYKLTLNLESLGEKLMVAEPDKTFDLVGVFASYYNKMTGGADNDDKATAKAKMRDARRVSDVRQMQTGAELYFSDASRYPDAMTAGASLTYSSNTYMTKIPANLESVDGTCPATKDYVYQAHNNGTSYSITYCLANETGAVPAGINHATPLGITDAKPAPRLDQQRYRDVSKLRDYLENYFEKNNKYPSNLDELKRFTEAQIGTKFESSTTPVAPKLDAWGDPIYGSNNSLTWPTNPKPVGKDCPDSDYLYQPSADGLNYTLTYCLNGDGSRYGYGYSNSKTPKGTQIANVWGDKEAEAKENLLEAISQLIYMFVSEFQTGTDMFSREQDSKTVSNVKMIMTAAELYFNDAASYPVAINPGQPLTYNTNTYMTKVPSAPTSYTNPDCSAPEYNGQYSYTPNQHYTDPERYTSYTISYCLNEKTGSIEKGKNHASPAGINDN